MDFTCDQCGGSFASEEGLASHKRDKHGIASKVSAPKISKKSRKSMIWAVIIALFLILGIWYYYREPDYGPENIPRKPIHWHPELQIVIDGEEQIIPKNIGITPTRHFPIHTHETDGILHLENNNPQLRDFYLGTFFEIWGKAFNKSCIFEYCTNNGTLKMTVNGKENFDFDKYFMHDGDEIIIEYARK